MMGYITLIPLLPLSAALVLGLFGRRIEGAVPRIAISALGASFALSVAAFVSTAARGPIRLDLYSLIRSGDLAVDVGLYLDPLSSLMLLLVTGVGSLVLIFSSRYMQGDSGYVRFFIVTSLFLFAMIMVVLSTNLLVLYFFWEVMGICSFLLIAHQRSRRTAADSAMRAFLVNAVADVGLGLAVFLTFSAFGTLDIQQVLSMATDGGDRTVRLFSWAGREWRVEAVGLIALGLLIGALGKSAQFPFHVWLPFAMEAPTPVSALIHAATLVKAGIYLLVRLSPLFLLAPAVMNLAALIGGATAIFAATVALTQTDIKRILAYSTMSQLGFMVMACGFGAYTVAVFHLLAHGALKSYFFLSAGSAVSSLPPFHAAVRDEGSASARHFTLSLGILLTASIIPAVIALSRYDRLWESGRWDGPSLLFWIFSLGMAFMTSVYLFRAASERLARPPRPGTLDRRLPFGGIVFSASVGIPVILGIGFSLAHIWTLFSNFLSPSLAGALRPPSGYAGNAITPFILAAGLAAALGGWATVRFGRFHIARISPAGAEAYKRLYIWTYNKGYIDENYDAFIIRPTLRLSHWLWRTVDRRFIGGWVEGTARVAVNFSSWLWESLDIGGFGRLVDGLARLTVTLALWLWRSVDIRGLSRGVDSMGGLTGSAARWLFQSVDIRGLERLGSIFGRRHVEAGHTIREIEPSMLHHQLLVMIFLLVLAMLFFLIFLS